MVMTNNSPSRRLSPSSVAGIRVVHTYAGMQVMYSRLFAAVSASRQTLCLAVVWCLRMFNGCKSDLLTATSFYEGVVGLLVGCVQLHEDSH